MAKAAENINLTKGTHRVANFSFLPGWVRKRISTFLLLATILLIDPVTLSGSLFFSQLLLIQNPIKATSYNQRIAPDFPINLQWLNTNKALRLRMLQGKVVLLDFWTYCCINCQHILPDLAMLEEKYPDELVVIGVHSGKFIGEKDSENIQQAILRHGIRHPVVNDAGMQIWQSYGIQAWPTLILIDPAGRVAGRHSGEGVFKAFDRSIASMIRQFDTRGLINREPLNLTLENDKVKNSVLSFPGGILADELSKRLFISDSGHNKIIIAGLEGNILEICGTGESGYIDGSFDTAKFNRPQGLALLDKKLFVADTGNHRVRIVDLVKKTVSTLAGTGKQGQNSNIRGLAYRAALNSPWDLQIIDRNLFVSMAGTHQIYRIDLKRNKITLFAGTGVEGLIDGPREQAALAQPSGLTSDGRRLYFTDSESSSIRRLDVNGNSIVTTIVGLGLFEFGDFDGQRPLARLQHPLGLAYHKGLIYVADTYNNKIKIVDPQTTTTRTFLGNGTAGSSDSPVTLFDEPGALSCCGDKLFIADTNNHLIRVADIKTAKTVTLPLGAVRIDYSSVSISGLNSK